MSGMTQITSPYLFQSVINAIIKQYYKSIYDKNYHKKVQKHTLHETNRPMACDSSVIIVINAERGWD